MAGKTPLWERVRALPWTSLMAVAIPMGSAGFQLWLSLAGDDIPVWLGPLESLGVTLLAVLVGLWLLMRSVREARSKADRYSVGEALAVGYGLNFLQPTGERLAASSAAARALSLSPGSDGTDTPAPQQVGQLLVALPTVVDDLDNASIVGLRRQLQQALGEGWWIGSARLGRADDAALPAGPQTQADKPHGAAGSGPQGLPRTGGGTGRGVGVTALVNRASGATVLIDLPSTLHVVPHFARFVVSQELEESPWSSELVLTARGSIVRRFEVGKFHRVLAAGLDGATPQASAEPSAEDLLRHELGAWRDHIRLVPMASLADIRPLLAAVREAARA